MKLSLAAERAKMTLSNQQVSARRAGAGSSSESGPAARIQDPHPRHGCGAHGSLMVARRPQSPFYPQSATVSIDGLFEGMDLHASVPRYALGRQGGQVDNVTECIPFVLLARGLPSPSSPQRPFRGHGCLHHIQNLGRHQGGADPGRPGDGRCPRGAPRRRRRAHAQGLSVLGRTPRSCVCLPPTRSHPFAAARALT